MRGLARCKGYAWVCLTSHTHLGVNSKASMFPQSLLPEKPDIISDYPKKPFPELQT